MDSTSNIFGNTTALAQQMRELNARVPMNHLGLPDGIYRTDMLPARPIPPVTTLGKNAVQASKTQQTLLLTYQPNQHNSDGSITATSNGFHNAPESSLESVSPPKPALQPAHSIHPTPEQEQEAYRKQVAQYDRDLVAAYVNLDYAEGYPTIEGTPFWHQFAFEPSEAFLMFECYLHLAQAGARQLIGVLHSPMLMELPYRPTVKQLEELFHIYNWAQRTRAYDMFFAAHRRKERERRSFETEDVHYAMSARLLAVCDAYLTANTEELAETMSPKAFIEFLKTAAQLQRISVGLNPNSPGSAAEMQAGTSAEVIMRTIAEKNNVGIIAENSEISAKNAQNVSKMAEILRSPELTKMAQEIIIRVSQPTQAPTPSLGQL